MTAFTQWLDRLAWEGFRNDSSSTVPPFGLMVITGSYQAGTVYKRTTLTCDRPGTTFYRELAVNGPTQVKAGKHGRCTRGPGSVWVNYDSGTPAAGDVYGPKPGQFTASKDYPCGVRVQGIKDTSKKLLVGTLQAIDRLIGETTGAISEDATSTAYIIHVGRSSDRNDAGYTTVPSAEFTEAVVDEQPIKITFPNGLALAEPLKCGAYPT